MKHILLAISLICCSCGLSNNNPKRIDVCMSYTYSEETIDSTRKIFMSNNPGYSYFVLRDYYCFGNGLLSAEDLLYYAIIAANRDSDTQACFDVYHIISGPGHSFEYVDAETRELALMFLKKGAEKKHTQSLWTLSNYYKEGKYLGKDETLAAKLRMEYDSITAANKERYRREQEQEQ